MGVKCDRRIARVEVEFPRIHALFTVGAAGALTDAELLERFLSRPSDEAEPAFAAPVLTRYVADLVM